MKNIIKIFFLLSVIILSCVVFTNCKKETLQESGREGIFLNRQSLPLARGEEKQLYVTNVPETNKVQWISDDSSIAKVSEDGKVSGVGPGRTIVRAKVGTKEIKCKIFVEIKLLSLSFKDKSLEIIKGEKAQTEILINPEDYPIDELVYSSSSEDIATVDPKTGEITASQPGKTTIKAELDGFEAFCEVEVIIPLQSITLSETELTVGVNKSKSLEATIDPLDATGVNLEWSVEDETIATVNQNGEVTGVSAGTTKLIVKSGEVKAECQITSVLSINDFTFSPNSLKLAIGKTEQLSLEIDPTTVEATEAVYKSLDESIATVSSDGLVTALAEGNTTIEITVRDITKTIDVKVFPEGMEAYALGDIYTDDAGVKGIVAYTENGGTEGLVISLNNEDSDWGTETVQVGVFDQDDAQANIDLLLADDPTLAKYPAAKWCKDKGEGWFLPAPNQLKNILSNMPKINESLGKNNGTALEYWQAYWTSAEDSQLGTSYGVVVRVEGEGTEPQIQRFQKTGSYWKAKVIAVRKF